MNHLPQFKFPAVPSINAFPVIYQQKDTLLAYKSAFWNRVTFLVTSPQILLFTRFPFPPRTVQLIKLIIDPTTPPPLSSQRADNWQGNTFTLAPDNQLTLFSWSSVDRRRQKYCQWIPSTLHLHSTDPLLIASEDHYQTMSSLWNVSESFIKRFRQYFASNSSSSSSSNCPRRTQNDHLWIKTAARVTHEFIEWDTLDTL